MEKLKKLFHHERKELVIIHPHLEPMKAIPLAPPAKKKRFSLNLLQQKTSQQEPAVSDRKRLAKSTSFLQLTQLFQSDNIKKSQSMNFEKEDDDASSCSETIVNEDLLHTAAVSSYPISPIHHERSDKKRQIYLQLGIQFYEKGELDNATHYWKLSATEENEITPLGTFFYGLSLLFGWGCRKSPAIAVRYFEKTMTCNTVNELHMAMTRSISCDKFAASIYQLGESFWHGWEVPKNVSIAVYYFELAALLGNPNAMNELGFCFQNGHGVNKDMAKAAEWYTQAAKYST